jgi:hypothetical protein
MASIGGTMFSWQPQANLLLAWLISISIYLFYGYESWHWSMMFVVAAVMWNVDVFCQAPVLSIWVAEEGDDLMVANN